MVLICAVAAVSCSLFDRIAKKEMGTLGPSFALLLQGNVLAARKACGSQVLW